jgi:hypothetical protein
MESWWRSMLAFFSGYTTFWRNSFGQIVFNQLVIWPKHLLWGYHSAKMCFVNLSFGQNVFCELVIRPKCVLWAYHSAKMCFVSLSFGQNVFWKLVSWPKTYLVNLSFGQNNFCRLFIWPNVFSRHVIRLKRVKATSTLDLLCIVNLSFGQIFGEFRIWQKSILVWQKCIGLIWARFISHCDILHQFEIWIVKA